MDLEDPELPGGDFLNMSDKADKVLVRFELFVEPTYWFY